MKFQAARLWIPLAGIARRLDISPRAIRRLDDCGVLTVRLIPRCQAQALANEVNRLVAQHSRPASARGQANLPLLEHVQESHDATAKLPAENVR